MDFAVPFVAYLLGTSYICSDNTYKVFIMYFNSYIVCFAIALLTMCTSCSNSIEPQQQAHNLFEQSKQYKKDKDVEQQISTLLQAYQLLPQFDEPAFASQVCQALGSVYMYRQLYDQSLNYDREAIAYALLEKPQGKRLSLAYSELGRTFAELNEVDSAFLYFEKALNQAKLLKDSFDIICPASLTNFRYRIA